MAMFRARVCYIIFATPILTNSPTSRHEEYRHPILRLYVVISLRVERTSL
jgi:hypothetical protein